MLLIETGGTHTRCGITNDGAPGNIALFDNANYPSLESVITAYLSQLDDCHRHEQAALAVAAPVDAQRVELTNLGWTVDSRRLREQFGWSNVVVINDFEALACAVPELNANELLSLQPAEPVPDTPVAVLGPGTGLGVSGLVPCGDTWQPIAGEGGHVTLAACDDDEAEVLKGLRDRHGHVSAERVLSGPGLLMLYQLLSKNPNVRHPFDVSHLADQGDQIALRTFDLFFGFLGTVAGDLALTLGARGGVYLGGGILPALKQRLMDSGFVQRFSDKGRFSGYLKRVPVDLILADTPALRGLALHPDVQVHLN